MLITENKALRAYRAETRVWQGIPSIEVTPGGRIFVCFYSGKTSETLGITAFCLLRRATGFRSRLQRSTPGRSTDVLTRAFGWIRWGGCG